MEASARLQRIQRETLAGHPHIEWTTTAAQLPDRPLLIIGNEIFDALPVRQYVKRGTDWRERLIGLDEHERLSFVVGPGTVDPALLPPGAGGSAWGGARPHG